MKFCHILLPTDFSAPAEHAAAVGLELAARDGARVLALHVLPIADLVIGEYPVVMVEDLQNELLADARKRMAEWAAKQSMAVETDIVWGNPAVDVCRIAGEKGVDLIVTATHGRTGLAHLFMGSVAERVVRHAPCSVLVVRQPAQS